jgi:hypothetical protein
MKRGGKTVPQPKSYSRRAVAGHIELETDLPLKVIFQQVHIGILIMCSITITSAGNYGSNVDQWPQ